ncbi:MAG: peptide deformylase [Bacteroidales bacterium]
MILPIYVYGSDVLRERAKEIDVKTEEGLQDFIDNLYVTMKEADGVGIAAPQVGRSIRLLIVDGADLADEMPELANFKRVMINPVVLWESDETATFSEGCLSVPNLHVDVIRPSEVKIKYINEKLEEVTENFLGFGCRMVQHEMDHLEGVLFVDRATPIRKKMIQGKLANIANGKVHTHYKIVKKNKK